MFVPIKLDSGPVKESEEEVATRNPDLEEKERRVFIP
jgi:hypothetical protein